MHAVANLATALVVSPNATHSSLRVAARIVFHPHCESDFLSARPEFPIPGFKCENILLKEFIHLCFTQQLLSFKKPADTDLFDQRQPEQEAPS